MGDIADKLFEGVAQRREQRNLERRKLILESQGALDDDKRAFAAKVAAEDAEVLDAADESQLQQQLRSHLDTKRVGDAAAGDSAAGNEDAVRRQLDSEEGYYRREGESLKSDAIAAHGRLQGFLPRGKGYDGPTGGEEGSRQLGPLLLTVAVGVIEWLQTASWLSDNLSLWQASLGGFLRTFLVFFGSGLLTFIVMATTFLAGRKLKEGVVARRAATAEAAGSGIGGEIGQGIGIAIVAAMFQTITLGLRFSTETGDQGAQAAAIVVGLVSFCGAMVVFLWEYASFTPVASAGRAVFTRQADAAKVREFRQAEYRRMTGIPQAIRDLEVAALRREEDVLQKLQAAALKKGPTQMAVLNSQLAQIRSDIGALYGKPFDYDGFDLDAAAVQLSERLGRLK